MTMTDEQGFAWLRSKAPGAQQITVYDHPIKDARVVVLEGCGEPERKRVEVALGLRFPDIRWIVRATSPRLSARCDTAIDTNAQGDDR